MKAHPIALFWIYMLFPNYIQCSTYMRQQSNAMVKHIPFNNVWWNSIRTYHKHIYGRFWLLCCKVYFSKKLWNGLFLEPRYDAVTCFSVGWNSLEGVDQVVAYCVHHYFLFLIENRRLHVASFMPSLLKSYRN